MTGEILCQISATMSTTLKKYSTPPAHALYSTEFFEQINLQYAASMDYPIIAPQGALHRVFDDIIPSNISRPLLHLVKSFHASRTYCRFANKCQLPLIKVNSQLL